VMDQRGDRPRRKRIKASTIELLSGSSATSTPISL
jgi:hypothetical protein